MPGQGIALDGAEGRKVFNQFQEFAKTFPMPHNTDAKAQLMGVDCQNLSDDVPITELISIASKAMYALISNISEESKLRSLLDTQGSLPPNVCRPRWCLVVCVCPISLHL
jgi:hypothetical protein